MTIKVYEGHVVYYPGKWETNEQNEREIEKDDSRDGAVGTHYEFDSVSASSKEQLNYILSLQIKKEIGSTRPIYIAFSESTIDEVYAFPSYDERLDQVGGF